ncbi:MAG: SDR family NAD(P)-dependent oxidoreductase [Hyphomicrobiales bacterium]
MSARLKGLSALVTGGGDGIGLSAAQLFAQEGAHVLVADIVPERAQSAVETIKAAGGMATPLVGDVSDEASVRAMVEAGLAAMGRIDVLFNNAGGGSGRDGSVVDLDLDEFWRTIRVDLFGTLLCCRTVIPHMQKSGGGSIINISSLRALVGTAGADAYTASKGGVAALTRAMALQWAPHKIRVNAMAPGVVLTQRVAALIKPDNPIYQKMLLGPCDPQDVAELACYLASPASAKMTGAILPLDAGATAY